MLERQHKLMQMGAAEAAAAIRAGEIRSEELVDACLARIEEIEESVQAWAFLDAQYAREQARGADAARRAGRPLGALHGIPVGVKDIIDTADMPTEDGTVLHAGRRPHHDATVVSRLRCAGAVILGKTVTTELAMYAPGKTRNPHDLSRTPGGSSSGSAAAVATGMVPLALGTQTNGSVIRPASYCGVVGYKPTRGLVSTSGILRQSRPLDQPGVFARSLADAALIAQEIIGYDAADSSTRPQASQRLVECAAAEPPLPPRFAFVKTPMWDQASDDLAEAFQELVGHLGGHASEVELPEAFGEGVAAHRTILEADLALSFAPEYDQARDKLSANLREMLERGRRHLAVDYNRALARIALYNAALEGVFDEFHAILTPAATGEAPKGLESTGSPVFCTLWTLCGVPAVTLPLMQGASGMPIGVQLVGRAGDDARLLQYANWLVERIEGGASA